MKLVMTRRSVSLSVALGVLGGVVLVLGYVFFTPGKYLLLPYGAVVLATTLAIRAERLTSFVERFTTGLLSFLVSSIALYVAVALSPSAGSPDVGGHLWRLTFLVAVGALINLATARLARAPAGKYGEASAT